jgi:OmpA-OmpF porin, OOP family
VKSLSRRLLSACATSLVVLGASNAAFAQNSPSGWDRVKSAYLPGSTYIGFNVGRTDYSLGNGTGIFGNDKSDTSYGLNAGAYFNNYLGLEIGMNDFGDATRGGGTTEAYGFNISLIGKLPLNQNFNLLGKLGTTYGRTEVTSRPGSGIVAGKEDGFGVSYGIGAEYIFAPNVSAVLQYDEHYLKFIGTDRERVGTASVGLRYRF